MGTLGGAWSARAVSGIRPERGDREVEDAVVRLAGESGRVRGRDQGSFRGKKSVFSQPGPDAEQDQRGEKGRGGRGQHAVPGAAALAGPDGRGEGVLVDGDDRGQCGAVAVERPVGLAGGGTDVERD